MKLNTNIKPLFTGEYWNYTSEQGIDGQVTKTYFKVKDIEFSLISAEKGTMYLFMEEQLRYNAQVRVIKDNTGRLVFIDPLSGNGLVAYIGISEPVFDIYGTVIGFRHDLSQGVS